MPLTFDVDHDAGIVFTQADGLVTPEDLRRHVERLAATQGRPPLELADFSDQVHITVPPDAVRNAAWTLSDTDTPQPNSRLALVGRSDAVYAVLRLFQAHRDVEGLEIEVFRERDAAMAWLTGDDRWLDDVS